MRPSSNKSFYSFSVNKLDEWKKKIELKYSPQLNSIRDEKTLFLEQFRKTLKEKNHEEITKLLSTMLDQTDNKLQLHALENQIKIFIHSGDYETNFLDYIKSLVEKEYENDKQQGAFLRGESPAILAIQYYSEPYFDKEEKALAQNIVFNLKKALSSKGDLLENYVDYLTLFISLPNSRAKKIIFLLYDIVFNLENSKLKNPDDGISISASKYSFTFFFLRMVARSFPEILALQNHLSDTEKMLRKLLLEFPPSIFICALSNNYEFIRDNIKEKISPKDQVLLLKMVDNLEEKHQKELKEIVGLLHVRTESSSMKDWEQKEQRMAKYALPYKKQGSLVVERTVSYKKLSMSLFLPNNKSSKEEASSKEEWLSSKPSVP